MADPPGYCVARATNPTTITTPALQLDAVAVGPEGANTTNMDIIATRANTASVLNTNAAVIGCRLVAADRNAAVSPSVKHIATALMSTVATHESPTATLNSQHPGAVSEGQEAASANNNPSLFAKLPGELRNRIYRLYFEDFREQKKKTLDIKKAAPTYLKLLHTDRMIRSEASSIFYKEHFCVDNFVALSGCLERALESRIKAICALVAIRDIHLPISITVQELTTMEESVMRQRPFPWNDSARCDLIDTLERFMMTGTRRTCVCSSGSQQRPKDTEHPPYVHKLYGLGPRVHVSPGYPVERGHSDAAFSPQQRCTQRSLQQLGRLTKQQLWQINRVRRPRHEGLDPQLEKLKVAESIHVEGPLAELDWDTFEWNSEGALQRWHENM